MSPMGEKDKEMPITFWSTRKAEPQMLVFVTMKSTCRNSQIPVAPQGTAKHCDTSSTSSSSDATSSSSAMTTWEDICRASIVIRTGSFPFSPCCSEKECLLFFPQNF